MATAGIGVLMIGLLVAWGTAYGTWLDEIGPFIDDAGAGPDAPTIVLPGLVGLLALALVPLSGCELLEQIDDLGTDTDTVAPAPTISPAAVDFWTRSRRS